MVWRAYFVVSSYPVREHFSFMFKPFGLIMAIFYFWFSLSHITVCGYTFCTTFLDEQIISMDVLGVH